MNENINDNGMFEDVKAMAMVESAEVKSLRSKLNIAEDCIQQLKAELFKVESDRRNTINNLQRENASLRHALVNALRESEDAARKFGFEKLEHSHTKRELANAKAELKAWQCKTAALIRWKNFFRDELTAQEYINAYQEQDIDNLKNKLVESIQPGMLGLLNAVRNAPVVNEEPLMLAAETE